MISNQEAGQLDEQEIPVPENNEESSRGHEGVLMNCPSASAIACVTVENMIKKASGLLSEQPKNILIEESALKDRQYGEKPIFNAINLCNRDDPTLLQKVDKKCFPSTSTKKAFIDSGLIATEFDTQKACNSEETEKPLPSNKRFKRSSSSSTESISPDEMNDTASEGDSSFGFGTKSNSPENKLVDVTAETTTNNHSSEDDSFNQPTTQSTHSDKKVGSVVIRESKFIIGSQTYTSSQITTEVVSVFHKVFNLIRNFCKSKPAGIQTIQQGSSCKRPSVPIQNPQQSPAVKLETNVRLSTSILSRINPQINGLKCSDTQEKDPEVSFECSQESQEISPISVAEFSVNNSLLRSRLGDELFYIQMLLFDDLEMLAELSSLIIMGFRSESEKRKIADYILCFDIMEEDYTEKVKLFKNIKKDVKSEKEKCSYQVQLLQIKDIIKVINKCIMYVEYGIHLVKNIYENIEKAKQSTSGKSHKQ